MKYLDVEKVVREALKNQTDPHMAVLKEINKLSPEGSKKWEETPADRNLVKYFVMGFLYSRRLEIDSENWKLRTFTDEELAKR